MAVLVGKGRFMRAPLQAAPQRGAGRLSVFLGEVGMACPRAHACAYRFRILDSRFAPHKILHYQHSRCHYPHLLGAEPHLLGAEPHLLGG